MIRQDLPSKLTFIGLRFVGEDESVCRPLHEFSSDFQDEFSKREEFKIGESIILENKNYKIMNIIFNQFRNQKEIIDCREERAIHSFMDIEIILEFERVITS